MTDVNGNPVSTFVYNGTASLPVRTISRANGKEAEWYGETAAKITNLSALKTVLGVKHFFMYIGYVIVYSIASGLITDYILGMIVK